MKRLSLALATVSATTAHADFNIQCNRHGAVMTTSNGEIYYLGKNCDAAKKSGGSGRWWFAASALIVEINGEGFRYPFDINCDLPYCKPVK